MENECSCIVMLCTLKEGEEVFCCSSFRLNICSFQRHESVFPISEQAIATGPSFRETQKHTVTSQSHRIRLRHLEIMSSGS